MSLVPAKRPISRRKVIFFILSVVASASFAHVLQPRYHDNSNALTVLATIFSILAGFMVAVLAMVSDERALRGANWRQDVVYLELIKRDMLRHQALFYLYLVVLSLAFVCAINVPLPQPAQIWGERLLLFLAFFAMLRSFSLPGIISRRHMEQLERLIKDRQDRETS